MEYFCIHTYSIVTVTCRWCTYSTRIQRWLSKTLKKSIAGSLCAYPPLPSPGSPLHFTSQVGKDIFFHVYVRPSEARTPQMHFLCSDDDRLPSDLYNICKIVREIALACTGAQVVLRILGCEVSGLRTKPRLRASSKVNLFTCKKNPFRGHRPDRRYCSGVLPTNRVAHLILPRPRPDTLFFFLFLLKDLSSRSAARSHTQTELTRIHNRGDRRSFWEKP
jgi:hypothetical protein